MKIAWGGFWKYRIEHFIDLDILVAASGLAIYMGFYNDMNCTEEKKSIYNLINEQ